MIKLFSSWQREIVFQFIYSTLAVTALIGPGMSMGYSGVTISLLSRNTTLGGLNFTPRTSTWFASIVTVSMPFGCLASLVTMKYGRRPALLSAGVTCAVGWIIVATSFSIFQLLLGRFITGFACGMVATPGSVYLAEIASIGLATMLTPVTSFFISCGSMIVYFLTLVLQEWRVVGYMSTIISSVSTVGIYFFLPESPRWYLSNGQKDKAKLSLMQLRGLTKENDRMEEEFNSMVSYNEIQYVSDSKKDHENFQKLTDIQKDSQVNNVPRPNTSQRIWHIVKLCWTTLLIPQVWKPFIIINIFFFTQQFCGLYVIMAYSDQFLAIAGVQQNTNLISVVIGLLQMISIVLLILCSNRIGRRPIAIISGTGMSITFLILGLHLQLFKNYGREWLPLICIMIYELTGSFGFLALPWAMIGEIYPTKFVNYLGPITTSMSGFYNFLSVQIFPTIAENDNFKIIYLYTIVSIIATLFVVTVLPETYGKSKADIEKQF